MYKFNVLYSNNTYDYNTSEFLRGSAFNHDYNVLYCNKVSMLSKVNDLSLELEKQSIIGFDTETALTNDHIDHSNEMPTIIQYGDRNNVIVINVSELLMSITLNELLNRLPSFVRILTSKSIIKVGVALIHDISKMKSMGITLGMHCDLQWMASCLGFQERGLNSIADRVIGSQKHFSNNNHDWYNVNNSMIEYAARDVVLPIIAFDILYEVLYNVLLTQLIPNMGIDVYYDLFDLSVIMINHSKHSIKSNVNIRNFIITCSNLFGLIVKTAIRDEYIEQVKDLYTKISDINSIIAIYNNPVVFVPLKREDYINADVNTINKLDYYEREQRVRIILPEENTIITELLNKSNIKKEQVLISYPITPESIKLANKYPQLANNAAKIMSLYDTYTNTYSLLNNLPCKPIGKDRNDKVMFESAINKSYKGILDVLAMYSLTPNNIGFNIKPIEEEKIECIKPVPYSQQISVDYIIGLIPNNVVRSDVDSFVLNIVEIQNSLRYLSNLPAILTKKDNILINENKNKYKSHMIKLADRVRRFRLSRDLFLRLSEPFKIE